jgi:putative flippase GtrA
VGLGVTALQEATYWLLAADAGWHPQLANFLGYLVAVVTGFVAHGQVTFRGHGAERRDAGHAFRFVTVSLFSLALNAFWIWLVIGVMGGALWAPIPLKMVVTPAFVFVLNRQWVFR